MDNSESCLWLCVSTSFEVLCQIWVGCVCMSCTFQWLAMRFIARSHLRQPVTKHSSWTTRGEARKLRQLVRSSWSFSGKAQVYSSCHWGRNLHLGNINNVAISEWRWINVSVLTTLTKFWQDLHLLFMLLLFASLRCYYDEIMWAFNAHFYLAFIKMKV